MPQSSARSFMVILLSGLVRSTFFSDASSARLVICDMSAPCCAAFSRIFCCCGVFRVAGGGARQASAVPGYCRVGDATLPRLSDCLLCAAWQQRNG